MGASLSMVTDQALLIEDVYSSETVRTSGKVKAVAGKTKTRNGGGCSR